MQGLPPWAQNPYTKVGSESLNVGSSSLIPELEAAWMSGRASNSPQSVAGDAPRHVGHHAAGCDGFHDHGVQTNWQAPWDAPGMKRA